MPGYTYRCTRCELTSPSVSGRAALEEARAAHRNTAHGGMIPDGEEVAGGLTGYQPRINVLAVLFIGGGLVSFWQWLTHLF